MNKILKLTIIILLLGYVKFSYAITGEEAVAKFQSRMNSIGSLTGIVSWTYSSSQTFTGSFKYMSPGKIFVKFSSPSGKIIVSNGKKLWVYDPGSNICGIQDLGGGHSGGIAGMTNGYLAIVTSQGPGGYTIKLKSHDKHYQEIILMVDSTFFIKKAILKGKDNEGFTFSISNVDTSSSVMSNIFNFNPPSNAQIVKNPLNVK
jgi:outer membrane lipoprotein carrier protein